MGVDSTALLIELHARGEAPDLVLTADTGSDKPESYAYLEIMKHWMAQRGIAFELVRYQPRRFKHWPPYYGIHEMALTNGTLPSISLGRHSCSLKYKKAPQDKYLASWPPALAAWAAGQKVIRLIGFDASPRDTIRYAHAATIPDALYEPRYPLREWGWNRERCTARIEAAGLPVPPKSSCFLCLGMTPEEVRALPSCDRPGRSPRRAAAAHRRRAVANDEQKAPGPDDRLHPRRAAASARRDRPHHR